VSSANALALAREVGDALCDAAEDRGGGLCWQRRLEWGEHTGYSPDLYAGAAGVGLFLAALARKTGEERYADAARAAARWVAGPVWGRGRAQHGFYEGEAGVAYFFLRLADLLDAPGYVRAAELRLRRLRGASCRTVDLMYGSAGTLLGLLAVHAVTGDEQYLTDARQAGDDLVATALRPPDGGDGCYWNVEAAYPGGPAIPYLGLFHGAAGIALALAHLGGVTGDERLSATARATADLLLERARVSDAGSLTWPRHLGDTAVGLQAPCHGAGGIGQFFLTLDRLMPDPRYRETAEAAGRTIAASWTSELRSGLCHGVSGAGDFMLECYQAFGDRRWLTAARQCAGRLDGFRVPEQPGVYAMRDVDAVSPDLLLGYAGVGAFLLRLADPARATDLILGPLNNSLLKGERDV
jgi:lantibiotic modifying enzyme